MTVGIQHDQRLVVHTQIAGRPRFEEFLESADPTGQHDECVGALLHDLLPLAHGVGDDQFVGFDVGEFAVHQGLGDHPYGSAVVRAGGGSHCTHCRHVASAGHQCPAAVGDGGADAGRHRQQLGMPRSRRAVDAHRPLAVIFFGEFGVFWHAANSRRRVPAGRSGATREVGRRAGAERPGEVGTAGRSEATRGSWHGGQERSGQPTFGAFIGLARRAHHRIRRCLSTG